MRPKTAPRCAHSRALARTVVFAICALAALSPFEWARIPTRSMEPTLQGGAAGQDWMLWRPLFRELPRPHTIVIARHPLVPAQRIVKRFVSGPNRRILIAGGDLWVAPPGSRESLEDLFAKGQAAPDRAVEARIAARFVRHPLATAGQLALRSASDWEALYALREGSEKALGRGAEESLRIETEGKVALRLLIPIDDRAAEEVLSGQRGEPVPDLELRFALRPQHARGKLQIVIYDPWRDRELQATLSCGESAAASARLDLGDRPLGRMEAALAPQTWTSVRLRCVDGRYTLHLAGHEPLSRDAPSPPREFPKGEAWIEIRAEQAALDFRWISLHRDQHWRAFPRADFDVPKGHGLLLGDGRFSEDARHWERLTVRSRLDGHEWTGPSRAVGVVPAGGDPANPKADAFGQFHFQTSAGDLVLLGPLLGFEIIRRDPSPFVPLKDLLGEASYAGRTPWSLRPLR